MVKRAIKRKFAGKSILSFALDVSAIAAIAVVALIVPPQIRKKQKKQAFWIFIATSKSALLVKYSTNNWILDSGVILYIYYNINLFNSIAPTSLRVIQGNILTLLIYNISAIIVKLLNLARVVLESILYILKLKLNLVNLFYLIKKGAKVSFLRGYIDILLKSSIKLLATTNL